MSTIQATVLSGDFNDAPFNFLKTPNAEGSKSFIYDDGKGIPTLGIGYALAIKVNGVWKQQDYSSDFSINGID